MNSESLKTLEPLLAPLMRVPVTPVNPLDMEGGTAYASSLLVEQDTRLLLAKCEGRRCLLAMDLGGSRIYKALEPVAVEEIAGQRTKFCHADTYQMDVLRFYFPWLSPKSFGRSGMSMGFGDRIGMASPGHLRTIRGKNVRPVLAQQSIRELTLTRRTYREVLDAASWSCFQEGWKEGFGADGDHLKSIDDIRRTMDLGFSMITLDCSEHIDGTIDAMDAVEVERAYGYLPSSLRSDLEQHYLGKSFTVGGHSFTYTQDQLRRIALIYGRALPFITQVWEDCIRSRKDRVDFELSIDETATPTSPEAHYLVAQELQHRGVELTTLAPRFAGDFQKGIDYIGDPSQFESLFRVHAGIADLFGYRLSIHSGSDKFTVFPSIGEHTKGRVHVKTAGTNWLEALRVICLHDPSLFRNMATHALARYQDALAYYHVTPDLSVIPAPELLADAELERWLNEPNPRQVLHITYGFLLTDEENGKPLFRDEFFRILQAEEETYARVLHAHIGRHIAELNRRLGSSSSASF